MARNPQQGEFIWGLPGKWREVRKCKLLLGGGVKVCNSVDRREGVSDDYDGGRLRKWSREDSFKTMEDGQKLGCENLSLIHI